MAGFSMLVPRVGSSNFDTLGAQQLYGYIRDKKKTVVRWNAGAIVKRLNALTAVLETTLQYSRPVSGVGAEPIDLDACSRLTDEAYQIQRTVRRFQTKVGASRRRREVLALQARLQLVLSRLGEAGAHARQRLGEEIVADAEALVDLVRESKWATRDIILLERWIHADSNNVRKVEALVRTILARVLSRYKRRKPPKELARAVGALSSKLEGLHQYESSWSDEQIRRQLRCELAEKLGALYDEAADHKDEEGSSVLHLGCGWYFGRQRLVHGLGSERVGFKLLQRYREDFDNVEKAADGRPMGPSWLRGFYDAFIEAYRRGLGDPDSLSEEFERAMDEVELLLGAYEDLGASPPQ